MKQLIIMVASIMLGIALFYMIAGPQDDSVYSQVGRIWDSEIELRNITAEPGRAE